MENNKVKVLVTGANGYIGNHVVKKLISYGYDVYASDFNFDRVDPLAHRITEPIFSGKKNIYELMYKPDILIHLAWRNGFLHNDISHIVDLKKHYLFIKNMIDGGCKNISIMGTMHEIGYYEGMVDENTPTNPLSLYGISKNALRQMVFSLTQDKEVALHWLRAFYVIGDDDQNKSVFSKILAASKEGKESFSFSTGENKYDFLTIDELTEQIVLAATQTQITGIINCCSGKAIAIKDVAEHFINEHKLDIKLDYGSHQDRPYDSKLIYGNPSKILKITKQRGNTK